jgi:hypothetical protein
MIMAAMCLAGRGGANQTTAVEAGALPVDFHP